MSTLLYEIEIEGERYRVSNDDDGYPVVTKWRAYPNGNGSEGWNALDVDGDHVDLWEVAERLVADNATLRADLQRAKDELAGHKLLADQALHEWSRLTAEQRERANAAERRLEAANGLLRRREWRANDCCAYCGGHRYGAGHMGSCELAAHLCDEVPK